MHVQELEFEDARRHFEESKYLNKRLTELYVKHNTAGKTYEELFETMKFDTFLRAEEAVQHGFADPSGGEQMNTVQETVANLKGIPTRDELIKLLQKEIVEVTFTKLNGDERIMSLYTC